MFQQNYLYWLAGSILLVVALMSWRDKTNPRRLTTGLFWALYGLVFFVGNGPRIWWGRVLCISLLAWGLS